MTFNLDPRIQSSTHLIADWELSRVLLKNHADYPWLLLVPRVEDARAIDDLSRQQRVLLMEEIASISTILRKILNPDTLNVGALGNIVPQLHIHIVARFKQDPLWPQGIWQTALMEKGYSDKKLECLLHVLKTECRDIEHQD